MTCTQASTGTSSPPGLGGNGSLFATEGTGAQQGLLVEVPGVNAQVLFCFTRYDDIISD